MSFFSHKRVSTSKAQSPGAGAASMKQKDLWFESSTTLNGEEDQALTRDSYFKDGISMSQHNSSLSRRGRGEITLALYPYLSFVQRCELSPIDKVHDSSFRLPVPTCHLQLSVVCQCRCVQLLCVPEQTCSQCFQGTHQRADSCSSAEAAARHGQCAAQAAHSGDAQRITGESPGGIVHLFNLFKNVFILFLFILWLPYIEMFSMYHYQWHSLLVIYQWISIFFSQDHLPQGRRSLYL